MTVLGLVALCWQAHKLLINKKALWSGLALAGIITLALVKGQGDPVIWLNLLAVLCAAPCIGLAFLYEEELPAACRWLGLVSLTAFLINSLQLAFFNQTGFCGNQNYLGAVQSALIFPAWMALRDLQLRCRMKPGAAAWSAAVLLGILWLMQILKGSCRASLIAAVVIAVIALWRVGATSPIRRYAFGVMLLAGLAGAGFFFFTTQFGRDYIQRDVRLPLWQGVSAMVLDKPLLGVGPGNFESSFPPYDLTENQLRILNADHIEHPHNELLHIASQLGLLGLAAWLLWLWIAARSSPWSWWSHAPLVSFLVHGFFDKALVIQPSAGFFIVFLGLCSSGILAPEASGERYRRLYQAFAAGVLILGLSLLWPRIQSSWYNRQGIILSQDAVQDKALVAAAIAAHDHAMELNAWLPEAIFAGTTLRQVQANDPQAALEHLQQHLLPRYPDYSQIRRVAAQCCLTLAARATDAKQRQAWLSQALQHSRAALQRKQGNLNIYLEAMSIHLAAGDDKTALALYANYRAVIADKLRQDHAFSHLDQGQLAERWQGFTQYGPWYGWGANRLQMLKQDPWQLDVLCPPEFHTAPWLYDYIGHGPNGLDARYWAAVRAVQNAVQGCTLAELPTRLAKLRLPPELEAAGLGLAPEAPASLRHAAYAAQACRALQGHCLLLGRGEAIEQILMATDKEQLLLQAADLSVAPEQKAILQEDTRLSAYVPPAAFLLRNHAIGLVAGVPQLAPMPFLEIYGLRQRFGLSQAVQPRLEPWLTWRQLLAK